MTGGAWVAVAAMWTLGAGASPFAPVRYEVEPARIEPGQEAVATLTLDAPDGSYVTVRDAGPWPDPLELRGAWHVSREVREVGRVRWRFTRSFTAWEPGRYATPGVVLERADADGAVRDTTLGGVSVEAVSPLPVDAHQLRPSLPEGPLPGPDGWPGALAVLPLALMVGSGLAWWRTGRVGRGARAQAERGSADTARGLSPERWARAMRSAVAATSAAPGSAAVEIARLARLHPRIVAAGVRATHTTAEVEGLLRGSALSAPADPADPLAPMASMALSGQPDVPAAVSRALLLADGVKFGGVDVPPADVDRVGRALLESLGDA